jgi:5-formyltetrahydrofolate cyclo-ligase
MDLIKTQKNEIRQLVSERKKEIPPEEKRRLSGLIFPRVEKDPLFITSTIIMAYWSMDDEVYTHDFIRKWSKTKKIILPSVDGNTLRLKIYRGEEQLVIGQKYQIREPSGVDYEFPEKIELIIVPGIAFDKANNRLGRGKAYYDKLLKTLHAKKYGVCFSFQLFESIPVNQLDVKMDKIFTNPV